MYDSKYRFGFAEAGELKTTLTRIAVFGLDG